MSIKFKLIAFIIIFISANYASSETQIIYINGVQNTNDHAEESLKRIKEILDESRNHQGDKKISFGYSYVHNPIGFFDETDNQLDFFQDTKELYVLKTSEELFKEDLKKISHPHYRKEPIISEIELFQSSSKVTDHIFDMTPNECELVSNGKVTENEMRATRKAVLKLVDEIKKYENPIIVAHSQGNLIANLAYSKFMLDNSADENILNKLRVINVANTSEISVNSMSLTHADDRALFRVATSMTKLPSLYNNWNRSTTTCPNNQACDLVLEEPTFKNIRSLTIPAHNFVSTYLSDIQIPNQTETGEEQIINLTPDRLKFRDRFEDFVYAAANSFNTETERFTKISNSQCVTDSQTGLTWEVKQSGQSLHSAYDYFSWYEPDSNKNGGNAGVRNILGGGLPTYSCENFQPDNPATYCSTYDFVNRVNVEGWCGYNDWRLPTSNELLSLIKNGVGEPRIDTEYFPNTRIDEAYWTSDTDNSNPAFAMEVGFELIPDGAEYTALSSSPKDEVTREIRLVRGVR